MQQRGASMADVPGGGSGLLFRDSRGVARVDSGLVSLLAELRAHEQQAAQEIGQWQTKVVVEEKKIIDAPPEVIALGMFCSVETLMEMKRKILELRNPVAALEASKADQGE